MKSQRPDERPRTAERQTRDIRHGMSNSEHFECYNANKECETLRIAQVKRVAIAASPVHESTLDWHCAHLGLNLPSIWYFRYFEVSSEQAEICTGPTKTKRGSTAIAIAICIKPLFLSISPVRPQCKELLRNPHREALVS